MARKKKTQKQEAKVVKTPLNDEAYRSNNVHVQEAAPVVPRDNAVDPNSPAYVGVELDKNGRAKSVDKNYNIKGSYKRTNGRGEGSARSAGASKSCAPHARRC